MQDGRRRSGLVYPGQGEVAMARIPGSNPAYDGVLSSYDSRTGVATVSWQDQTGSMGIALSVNTSAGPVQSVSLIDSMLQSEDVTLQANKIFVVWGPRYGNYVHAKVRQTYVLCPGGASERGSYSLESMNERTLTASMYNHPEYGVVVTSDLAISGAPEIKLQIVV